MAALQQAGKGWLRAPPLPNKYISVVIPCLGVIMSYARGAERTRKVIVAALQQAGRCWLRAPSLPNKYIPVELPWWTVTMS